MIDMHIHVVPPMLPGVGPLHRSLQQSPEKVAAVLRDAMHAGGFTAAFAMGQYSTLVEDPLGVASTLRIAERVPGLYAIGIANPERNEPEFMNGVEEAIANGRVIALKGYLGYVHVMPTHPGYFPYYDLAAKYRIPFIFHTGDTWSPYAKLKYAHPLLIDEVAVDFPRTSFVMAHVGNPWMGDAAEVVYKNMNVWVDLSGLLVGETPEAFDDPERRQTRDDVIAKLRLALRYTERPNRLLYGSDWPLAPMKNYRDFIREAVPEELHDLVFEENARRLFRLEAP